jgi:hypothetical protein
MPMGGVRLQTGLAAVRVAHRHGAEAPCWRVSYRACESCGFRCPACGRRPWSRCRRVGRLALPDDADRRRNMYRASAAIGNPECLAALR